MDNKKNNLLNSLIKKGANVPHPSSVYIAPSVKPGLISPNITIFPNCRIEGEKTCIGSLCVIGEESPVTIENCQLADNVRLKGGYFSGATFLSNASVGSGAHIRPATLVEEHTSCAHSVGLKQTVLMPFVTLGSLINFCDCLMAGGTDKKNHSEVGSSYVHFNYTPHQDKATPSLIGDVPRGVFLEKRPIFLGGQGGLVGPSRIAYGSVISAGTILRRDVMKENMLVCDTPSGQDSREYPYETASYGDIHRILVNNFIYLGNIHALYQWYIHVRSKFAQNDVLGKACFNGAVDKIKLMVLERIKRLSQLAENLEKSLNISSKKHGGKMPDKQYSEQNKFIKNWPKLKALLQPADKFNTGSKLRDKFLGDIDNLSSGITYIDAIKSLDPSTKQAGVKWLQSIVDSASALL